MLHCLLLYGLKIEMLKLSALSIGLNKIRYLEIHTLKLDHFYTFLFACKAKIDILKWRLTRLVQPENDTNISRTH